MRYRMPSRKEICKLSGDNDKEDKDRELSDFLCGNTQVLVSTDCAGMGVHVPDLQLVVNIGLPKNLWKFHRLLEEQVGTKLNKPSPSSFTGRDRLGRQLQH